MPGMNILEMKVFLALLAVVLTIVSVEMIINTTKEFGYQTAGLAAKPLWFLGRNGNPRGAGWDRLRFYNFRRAYVGGHRGVKW